MLKKMKKWTFQDKQDMIMLLKMFEDLAIVRREDGCIIVNVDKRNAEGKRDFSLGYENYILSDEILLSLEEGDFLNRGSMTAIIEKESY